MIVGAGWHSVPVIRDDGSVGDEFIVFPAENHKHPLIVAFDSPDCCKAADPDYVVSAGLSNESIGAIIRDADQSHGSAYLAPGTFSA